jgi:ATP-dependent DNA ligase
VKLPIPFSYPPMEARLVGELPEGREWEFEPKWDGFRCLVFRTGKTVELRSKSGQPFNRYFPELVAAFGDLDVAQFVLDGEIVVPVGDRLSFDELLLRIHPAASRVAKLATEHPALFIAFDLLVDADGQALVDEPLRERRRRLNRFAAEYLGQSTRVKLSPATTNRRTVDRWFRSLGGGLDGVIAKQLDLPYRSGDRTGMVKFKQKRTADCVVGGFRYASKGKWIGSLLLGLYDEDGLLHHVGFTSSLPASVHGAERDKLTRKLERLVKAPGFTGQAPGGPSRWSTKRSSEWEPLAPKLVVEVEYDHFTGGRFRHGTRFLRWRPDKAPRSCTMAQVVQESKTTLTLLSAARRTAAAEYRRG